MTTIIHMLQSNPEIWKAGIAVFILLLIVVLLSGIRRQIKKLNKSLKSITDGMQAYFNVILTEEPEPDKEAEAAQEENIRAQVEEMKKKEEEEKLFNSVLQEYFS